VVSVTPRPLFTPGNDPVPIVQEVGWTPGPNWTGAENLVATGFRSSDRPASSQSLYRLSYLAHKLISVLLFKCLKNHKLTFISLLHAQSTRPTWNSWWQLGTAHKQDTSALDTFKPTSHRNTTHNNSIQSTKETWKKLFNPIFYFYLCSLTQRQEVFKKLWDSKKYCAGH
jgi:hypothetical protein